MRLSDWSSDVFSSDLTCLAAIAGPFCPQPASNVRQVIRLALSASLRWARRAGGILLDFCHAHTVVTGAFIRRATLAAPPISSNMSLMLKIGRASCRKECSVRVDIGGRRILKKKKNQQIYKH